MLEYKHLHGTLERLIVSDAQVDSQIEQLLEQHTRVIPVEDRPSQAGDELLLDYAGFCDGEQFEGGTARDQTLVLGSGTFIPGFEEQLEGKRPGEEADVRVTFPTPYHAPALAGKEAVFHCRIKEVRLREKYAPDDAFARDVGGFESFAELREALRQGLQAYADRQADEDLKLRLLDELIEAEPGEVTDEQLGAAVDAQMKALEAQLARQGLTLDAYCQFTGKTRQQLRQDCTPDARKGLLRQRVIAQIAAREGVEADEDSVAEALRQLCRDNHMSMEQLTKVMDESAQQAVVQNVITQKTLDLIRDSAIIETVERKG